MDADKPRLGISSCLLGNMVRYDGGHVRDHYLSETLGNYVEWLPVCPEVECGLGIPREAMRLVGDPNNPRLITRNSKRDLTDKMNQWSIKRLKELSNESLDGFIFKSKSPSSGIGDVKIFSEKGIPYKKGAGLFGGAFVKEFPMLPVEDDGRLHNPELRENFIERVLVFHRWNNYIKKRISINGLVDFHTRMKYLIMSHSPKHYKILGNMVANAKKLSMTNAHAQYVSTLMEGLRFMATANKNTNVLQHVIGYFKKNISSLEKEELLTIIDNYRKGFVPLIVPITLINHYVAKYDEQYLKQQVYLNPHPIELMLRNHV